MALVPWRPFEDFGTLASEMDRLLERFFGEPSGVDRPVGMWTPHTNVTETKDSTDHHGQLPQLGGQRRRRGHLRGHANHKREEVAGERGEG